MTKSPSTPRSPIKTLFKGVQSSVLNHDSFRNELKKKKLSGELVIRNGNLSISLLFFEGSPVLDSKHVGIPKTLELSQSPNAVLDFFILEPRLALAYSSAINGKRIWEGDNIGKDQIKTIASLSQQKKMTGNLTIQNGDGRVNRLFMKEGKLLGLFNVENNWEKVEADRVLKNHGNRLELFVAAPLGTTTPLPDEINTTAETEVDYVQSFEEFLIPFNDFISQLTNKIGEKPVKNSIAKFFDASPLISLRGIKLQKAASCKTCSQDELQSFGQSLRQFFATMVDVVGKQWMGDQLGDFRVEHQAILEKLDLATIFSV